MLNARLRDILNDHGIGLIPLGIGVLGALFVIGVLITPSGKYAAQDLFNTLLFGLGMLVLAFILGIIWMKAKQSGLFDEYDE